MMRPSLALVIPTYCRVDILRDGISAMADMLREHDVALYISDDSPDDATATMVEQFRAHLPKIQYRRNDPPLRHDRNILSSLQWPTEDYVWILGDAGHVVADGFARVLAALDDQDFLFVNSHAAHGPDRPVMTGEDARCFVRDHLWHQTLTGATIYARRVLDWMTTNGFQTVPPTPNFPHLSLLLDYLAAQPAETRIGWIGTSMTRFVPKNSYWRRNALSTFVDDWSAVVRRQPTVIRPDERHAVIREHSLRGQLFNLDLLLELRRAGTLNRDYLRRQPDAWQAIHQPAWLLRLVTYLPPALFERAIALRRRLKHSS